MSKSNVLELAKKLVAAIEKEDRKNKVMLKDIPVGGKFDTGIGRFIVLEREKDYTAVITDELYREDVKFDDDCTEYRKSSLRELCEGEILDEFSEEFGEENICTNEAGLVTVDGQEVFGKLLTKVRPLTFDEAREYNDLLVNKDLPDWYWTCTPWSATGDYGASSATGYKGKSAAENQNSVAVAWGPEAMAKGVKGSTLVLAEWKRIDNDAWYWKEEVWDFIGSLMVRVDGEKVKENTWYTLKNGELVEVEDE